MSIYTPGLSRRETSPIARAAAAREAADAREADRTDPHRNLIRRVRVETLALAQVEQTAAVAHERANALVPPPVAVRGHIHPTRAEALAAFVREQGWSDNPHDAVGAVPTLADVVAAVGAETRQRLEEAKADLADFEEERRKDALSE